MLALVVASALCPAQPQPVPRLTAGEKLEYKLDLIGADVGTFTIQLEKPPATTGAAWQVKSHAKTSAFVSTNVGQYDAFVSVTATKEMLPVHYREDVDDGQVHRSAEADFAPRTGPLDVRATAAGRAEDVRLDASPFAREMLTSLYLLRAQPMKVGQKICLEAYGGRKMWKVDGAIAARETIDTPLGRFPTMRIDAVATRVDDANIRRAAHVWITDDDRRLPLVALGEARGKTIRAQLIETNLLPRKRAQASEAPHRNAIGR